MRIPKRFSPSGLHRRDHPSVAVAKIPHFLFLTLFFFSWLNPLILAGENPRSGPSKAKKAEKLMQLPDVKFYLFGMGNRRKFLYRDGTLFDALTGKTVRRWQVTEETILPSQYTVRLKTSDGQTIILTEDEQAVWLQDGAGTSAKRLRLTEGPIHLPEFQGLIRCRLLVFCKHIATTAASRYQGFE
ncbi:hypothetical protein ES703_61310 [subsurface metagenome]